MLLDVRWLARFLRSRKHLDTHRVAIEARHLPRAVHAA